LNLPEGEKLTTFDLLRSSIIGSDNDTAMALAHSTGYSNQVFVGLMNEKARMLSMKHSSFADQTGLSAKDVSTPHDIALLAAEAFSKPEIQEPAHMAEHKQETVDTHHFSRVVTTDQLLYDRDLTITGGKTGYTEEAGYCFVVQAQVPGSDRQIIAVVLGTQTEQARFDEAKKLLQWSFAHYNWNVSEAATQ
jgi:D-alanyl-D-alanine carboxypeptidase (penicillin-binding protein 5/6)